MKKKVSSCTFFSHTAGLPETNYLYGQPYAYVMQTQRNRNSNPTRL